MKRIYLAGPMSGIPEHNYPAFNAEAARLRALGYDVVNPAEINTDPAIEWADALRNDIPQLLTCDTLALQLGWSASKGANLEYLIAYALGMNIIDARKITTGPEQEAAA